MNKLTLLEDIMPDEIVRYYFPTADEEDVDFVLWNRSCCPYGRIEKTNDGICECYLICKV